MFPGNMASRDPCSPGTGCKPRDTCICVDFYSAAALLAVQSAVIPTAIPSVCLSVCMSHAGSLSRQMKIGSRGLHCEVAKTLSSDGWGRRPLPPKICAQSDPPTSEKCRLRPVSAYNVSTVRASEKKFNYRE